MFLHWADAPPASCIRLRQCQKQLPANLLRGLGSQQRRQAGHLRTATKRFGQHAGRWCGIN